MTECLREELNSGNDECLLKVLKYLEDKSKTYFDKLSTAFGSSEYFRHFQELYETSELPVANEQDVSILQEHLHTILQWRAMLAAEVEMLQCIREEIEDYPKDFEIQIRLSESLHEQSRLRREYETLREQNERLQMENNAYSAIMDEVKRDFNDKIAEANGRAKRAEKAFIELTRRRSTIPLSESSNPLSKYSVDSTSTNKSSAVVLDAMTSVAFPCKTSMDKVRNSSMRFKEYSTLTAWEGFDSLEEDSADEGEKENPLLLKSEKLGSQSSSSPTPLPEVQPDSADFVSKLPSFDASPIKPRTMESPMEISELDPAGVTTSLSSTPRKSLPSMLTQPCRTDALLLESVNASSQTTENFATSCPHKIAEVEESNVVDKAAYLKLYDEVLELRSELEKAQGIPVPSHSSTTSTQANDLGLTTQLCDLHDQVCDPSTKEASFASPARIAGGTVPIPIPLSENKHFTDWSISLDQTNASCVPVESEKSPGPNECEEESTHTPHASVCLVVDVSGSEVKVVHISTPSRPRYCIVSTQATLLMPEQATTVSFGFQEEKKLGGDNSELGESLTDRITSPFVSLVVNESPPQISTNCSTSVGQQTELPFHCFNCSTDSVTTNLDFVPLPETNPSVVGVSVLSPASTLQELNVDFSESITRQGVAPEYIESACSPIPELIAKTDQPSESPSLNSEVLQEQNHNLLDTLADAANVCLGLQKRLSTVQCREVSPFNCDLRDIIGDDAPSLTPILQQLSDEVEQISTAFIELKEKQASQPSYEAEIIKLREKLEEAERLLEERLPSDSQLAAMRMSEVLEAERMQLQRELNQRLADCGSSHATSVAELEQLQADLSARLSASEVRANNLQNERDAVVQKLNATERFLNEQLQEREQERDEFQSEVTLLRKEVAALRTKLTSLERQKSQETSSTSSMTHTPNVSPRKVAKRPTWATSTPTTCQRPRTLTPTLLSIPDSSDHSDVDDSPVFELAATSHDMIDRLPDLPSVRRRDWGRPYSADDALLRQQSQLPVKLITTCVGGSPVELVDASVSVQISLSSSSSSSTELDGEDGDFVPTEEEDDDVQTTTTTAAAVGVFSKTVTMTSKKRPCSRTISRRRGRSSQNCTVNSPEAANVIGLDVEMRHVVEMEEMREALALAQSSLVEKSSELETLRNRMNLISQPPAVEDHKLLQLPCDIKSHESVQVQTLPSVPPDPGACWSCSAALSNYIVTSVQTPHISPRDSRESTLSPPPVIERSSSSSSSSNAEVSVSTPNSKASSEAVVIGTQMVDEEELCEPLEHVFSSDDNQLVTDLEEARAEIQALKTEINGLVNYQDDLLRDFETVQSMLEERQSEVERLQKEILDVPIRLQADFDASVRKFQKRMNDKCDVVEERDEDLYVLNEEKEALAHRVSELEKELALLRDTISGTQAEVVREDTAFQTDPPHQTVESGIQIDLEAFSPISKTQSCADTDCVNEEDLAFDENLLASTRADTGNLAAPKSVEEALAVVDHLQQESCRLLSLSLTTAEPQTPPRGGGDLTERNDCKSQLISRLIEANRTLKVVIETITKGHSLLDHQTETEMANKLSVSPSNNRKSDGQLYSTLLSALLIDRKADLSLITARTIDQASNAAITGVLARPRSTRPKSASQVNTNDIMKALADYTTTEEERWMLLSSAIESDRENIIANSDSLKRREESLLGEVAHLTKLLAVRDTSLAEKAATVNKLSAELNTMEIAVSELKKELIDAKAWNTNQLALSRRQIDEEWQHAAELESTLQASQTALMKAREQVASLESDLEKSSANVRLEQNRSHLAEARIAQLEQEIKTLKASYVRIGPKANVNGSISLPQTIGLNKNASSALANISSHLTSVHLQAIQAEKMSRELHNCTRDLRVSLAETELALLPVSLGKENGHLGGSSGSTSGDESPFSGEAIIPPLPKQLTDSGFADAPAGLRRLHLTCVRLMRLVSLVTGDHSAPSPAASSSSSDSLNNPAELLRHAVLGGKKNDFAEQLGVADVYACLAEIQSHIRSLIGDPVDNAHVPSAPSATAASVLLAQAKKLLLNGVAYLDSGLVKIGGSTQNALVCHAPSEDKSIQCSLLSNHQSSGDSRSVSLEKFRHMSARYLREESYRRALIYQKQYLFLLLGDFQQTAERVTANLGQGFLMGASSRRNTKDHLLSCQRWPFESPLPLVRFRAAARCIMFIHRVRQLRLKWERTGIRSRASLFPHHGDKTLGYSCNSVVNKSSTLVEASSSQGDIFLQQRTSGTPPASHPLDRSLFSPQPRLLDSGLNHQTASIGKSCPPYPQVGHLDTSSSVNHHRIPTSIPSSSSSSSFGRFRWGSFRG